VPIVPASFWLSIFVLNHHLAVVPQCSSKDQLYCHVYYITLNSISAAHKISINLKNVVEAFVAKINKWVN
jgi:hypothetical protein